MTHSVPVSCSANEKLPGMSCSALIICCTRNQIKVRWDGSELGLSCQKFEQPDIQNNARTITHAMSMLRLVAAREEWRPCGSHRTATVSQTAEKVDRKASEYTSALWLAVDGDLTSWPTTALIHDGAPWYTALIVQESFEEHHEQFKVLTFPDLSPSSL